jgi:hypothetical protein
MAHNDEHLVRARTVCGTALVALCFAASIVGCSHSASKPTAADGGAEEPDRQTLLARYEANEAAADALASYVKVDGLWYTEARGGGAGYPVAPGIAVVRPVPHREPAAVFASLMDSSLPRIDEFVVHPEPITGEYYSVTFPEDLDIIEVIDRLKATGLLAYVEPSIGAELDAGDFAASVH